MSNRRPVLSSFSRKPVGDPAADAAQLLRRIGFAILVLVLPVASVAARRAIVVLAPLGAALLILATVLESEGRQPLRRMTAALIAPPAWPLLFLAFWAALSIVWTPFASEAAERLLRVTGMGCLAVAAAAAIPARMRASNLWLAPLGVGFAAGALVAFGLFLPGIDVSGDTEGPIMMRAAAGILLLAFPAFGWVAIRGRKIWMAVLAAIVAIAVVFVGNPAVMAAAIVGVGAFVLTQVSRPWGIRIVRTVLAGSLVLAPLLPFVLRPVVKSLFGPLDPVTVSVRIWAGVVTAEPWRLITGHGLETALRGQFVGMLPVGAPRSLLFELWYELGLLGAVAAAAAVWLAVTAAQRIGGVMAPCLVGAIACGFSLAAFGVMGGQTWALASISVLAISFVAIANGQFSTTRPRAIAL